MYIISFTLQTKKPDVNERLLDDSAHKRIKLAMTHFSRHTHLTLPGRNAHLTAIDAAKSVFLRHNVAIAIDLIVWSMNTGDSFFSSPVPSVALRRFLLLFLCKLSVRLLGLPTDRPRTLVGCPRLTSFSPFCLFRKLNDDRRFFLCSNNATFLKRPVLVSRAKISLVSFRETDDSILMKFDK